MNPIATRRFFAKSLAAPIALALPALSLSAAPPDTTYRLVFADEFNGPTLDTSKWSAASPGWTMPNSASTASASQVSLADGLLTLNATRTSSTAFSSGSISSYQKYNFAGGYVEARIQLPTTPGSWPAFWGLYTGWPPEADVMEYPLTTNGGSSGLANNQYNTNYHYTNSSGAAAAGAGVVTASANLAGSWHTFGMNWNAGASMTFYLDGVNVRSYTGSSVAQMVNMYMILDYAVGGWPGTPTTTQWPIGFSDQTKLDWVRVWQKNPNNDAPSNWTLNGGGSFTTSGNWSLGVPAYGNQTAVFGRVGSAAAAAITMDAWTVLGGITFNGAGDGTTAYTLGASTSAIQLATTSTAGAIVQASSSSTAPQAINATVELWSNTTFRNDMTGHQPLNFTGVISGSGSLTVVGAGPVEFSNNNTYTGDTSIGTSTTPAATALVTRSRPFGSTGTVYLGMQGNANAALIQIQDSRSVPNTIQFAGRGASTTDNATPAIENLAGNNDFTGTLNLVKGGANYIIQSDAGLLTLSGSTDVTTPGVALQAAPGVGGARTITLTGAGDGAFTGAVQNGSAAPLAIVKNGTGKWTMGGTAANGYSGSTRINAGSLELAKPAGVVAIPGDLQVFGGGSVKALADGQIAPTANVIVANAGSLLDLGGHPQTLASLSVTGNGAMTVGATTTGAPPLRVSGAFAVTTGGRLDLANNKLIVDYDPASGTTTPIASIRAALVSAYAGGAWNGVAGIGSAGIAATRSLGYAEASEALGAAGGNFGGQNVDGTTVLVGYTLSGDANLDGTVDFLDLAKLAQNYNASVSASSSTWYRGDFNYDGMVDFNDLAKLAQNYNTSLPAAAIPGAPADFQADLARAFATVPEPSAVIVIGLAGLCALTRRSRRQPLTRCRR